MDVDWEGLAAAGLYDPDAETAEDRRALLEFLLTEGCTVEEMIEADARGRLFGLAGDRILRPGRDRFTLAEIAAELNCDPELLRRAWRAVGLVDRGLDVPVASAADVAAWPIYRDVVDFVGEESALSLARVWGSAMARIADAEAAVGRALTDLASVSQGGSEAGTAQYWAAAASFYPRASQFLDVLHRHHAENSIREFEASGSDELARSHQARFAIGFADLTGFTALSETMDPGDLSFMLARFEEAAVDICHDRGGRVVKFIGDAAMIVAPQPAQLADIAVTMIEADQEGIARVPVRVGLSYGALLTRDGDFFGADVNLASRLVSVAEPDTILTSATFAQALSPSEWKLDENPPRAIRGVRDPVTTFTLRRA